MFLYCKDTFFLTFKEMEIRRQGHEMKAMLREDARSVLNEEANKKKKLEEKMPPPQPKTPPGPPPQPKTPPGPPPHIATTSKASQPKHTPAVKTAPRYVPLRPYTTTNATTTTTTKTTTTSRASNTVPHGVIRCIATGLNFGFFLLVIFVYVYTNQGEEEDMVSESNTKASYIN